LIIDAINYWWTNVHLNQCYHIGKINQGAAVDFKKTKNYNLNSIVVQVDDLDKTD